MKFWPFKKPVAPPEDGRIALGNFNLGAQMPNQATITVAGYIYSDDDKSALNERLDMYQEVIDRQRSRAEIPVLEATLDQRMKGLDQAREVLAELVTRQKNGEQLSSQERMNIKNMGVNIAKAREDIDKGHKEIAERKLKTGVK